MYVVLTIPPVLVHWQTTLSDGPGTAVSGRACFLVAAMAGDVLAVSGRRVGSLTGELLGPEWGAFGARLLLGLGLIGGATAFALLCFVRNTLSVKSD